MKRLQYIQLFRYLICLTVLATVVSGCTSTGKTNKEQGDISVTDKNNNIKMNTKESYKIRGNHNPLMTQRFGADPWALVYDNTVYVYMTADAIEKDADGKIIDNTYGYIHRINIISSRDLVNWTDCGSVDVSMPSVTKWAHNSWAPAAAAKRIGDKMQFFLYFANSANGIGVLRSDSPVGPFTDPIGKPLVDRSVPNCKNVVWMFDPAVFVDTDGSSYLYFGGGVPKGSEAHPLTARAVELGSDMVSLASVPVTIDAPYMFEDSGINKIGDIYYYSYCTNWSVPAAETIKEGLSNGQIAYMTSPGPLGPFTPGGMVLPNPGQFFGDWGNNHHCIFQFRGKWYIVYHAQLLASEMNIHHGYRSTNIDLLTIGDDGKLKQGVCTRTGVPQVSSVDPYECHSAAMMSAMAGIDTIGADSKSQRDGCGNMVVTGIDPGDWVFVEGVDFGTSGAVRFSASVEKHRQCSGGIRVYVDAFENPIAGYVDATQSSALNTWQTMTVPLNFSLKGKHNLLFVFSGSDFDWSDWKFSK